jgi:hypothetical protein
MASDQTHWRRHRALASVYHHGRADALPGKVRPRHLLPLEQAVDELMQKDPDEEDHDVRRSVRLALADLCRTLAAGPDDRADAQIHRLAAWLDSDSPGAQESGLQFTAMFAEDAKERPTDPDDAFVKALGRIVSLESGRRERLAAAGVAPNFVPVVPSHYRVERLKTPPAAPPEEPGPEPGTEPGREPPLGTPVPA